MEKIGVISLNDIELKLCDIQGRLFELSEEKEYNSAEFIKIFMTSETAKELDSKYNRMQWAGEEYLLEEVVEKAGEKLRKTGGKFIPEISFIGSVIFIVTGITIQEKQVIKYTVRLLKRQ